MKTIVFYSDVKSIGGHELLALDAAKYLSYRYDVVFIYSSDNKDLERLLLKVEKIKIKQISYCSNRTQFLRNFFSFSTKKNINKIFQEIKADLCILVQGNIETSQLPTSICKKSRIRCISYIPLTQPLKRTSQNKIVGSIKDIFRKYYYSLPDSFITISDSLKRNILEICPQKKVFVVPNKINFDKLKFMDKDEARQNLNLDKDKFILGYVGRIEAWHKGLDLYFEFLSTFANNYPNVIFLFVGKGNYIYKLNELKDQYPNIKYIPWIDNPGEVYSAIDGIILPSRYEGVSLSMLESMYKGLPIIASRIPEYEEFISDEYLFSLGNVRELDEKIKKIISVSQKTYKIPNYIFANKNSFEENFMAVITSALNEI